MMPTVDDPAIDLTAPGARAYELRLPAISSSGARIAAETAVHVLVGRPGPTLLVAAGVHGDEYEGQIVTRRILGHLGPADIAGRLIVLPSVNRPAAEAGIRRSPLDGQDLGRLFPEGAGEGPSAVIARWISDRLLPEADAVFDFHSGGNAVRFVPSINLMAAVGSPWYEHCKPAMLAFGAPWAIIFDEVGRDLAMPHRGTLEGAAIARKIPAFSTELPGGGLIDGKAVAMAEQGLLSMMSHFGMLKRARRGVAPSRLVALSRPEHYLPPPAPGVFAPLVDLGDEVAEGAELARVYEPGGGIEPVERIRAPCAGIVVAMASGARPMPEVSSFFLAEPL
jgi:predicted deacylase